MFMQPDPQLRRWCTGSGCAPPRRLRAGRCIRHQPPRVFQIAPKVVFPLSEAEKVGSLWGRIFKGTDSPVQPNACKEYSTAGPFALRQSRREAPTPGLHAHGAPLRQRGHRHAPGLPRTRATAPARIPT